MHKKLRAELHKRRNHLGTGYRSRGRSIMADVKARDTMRMRYGFIWLWIELIGGLS
jgi:hypothetical protein